MSPQGRRATPSRSPGGTNIRRPLRSKVDLTATEYTKSRFAPRLDARLPAACQRKWGEPKQPRRKEVLPGSESRFASDARASFPPVVPGKVRGVTPCSSLPGHRSEEMRLLRPCPSSADLNSTPQDAPPARRQLPPASRGQHRENRGGFARRRTDHAGETLAMRRKTRNKSARSARKGFSILRPRGNRR